MLFNHPLCICPEKFKISLSYSLVHKRNSSFLMLPSKILVNSKVINKIYTFKHVNAATLNFYNLTEEENVSYA